MTCIKIDLNKTKVLTWRIEELNKIMSTKIVSEIYKIERTSSEIDEHQNHERFLSSSFLFFFWI